MNQTQRQYLIKKIEEMAKVKINALENAIPDAPSLNVYLLHVVMSGKFQIRSNEEIKEMIRQMALKTKERDDWMGNSWGSANKKDIHFKADEFFIVPDEYKQLKDAYLKEKERLNSEIQEIRVQVDSLITRIQLASDKTLQTMINEVDDMGNISLMDTKIKHLTGNTVSKQIENQ